MERQRQIDVLHAKIELRRLQLYKLELELRLLVSNNSNNVTLQELTKRRRLALEQHPHEWQKNNGPSYRRHPSVEDEIV